MEMSIQEALELLGLGPEATMSDIRSAYRRSVRKWHPDMHRVIGGDTSRYRGTVLTMEPAREPCSTREAGAAR